MTGYMGFSTTVVLVTIMDRGCQSRSFSSLISFASSARTKDSVANENVRTMNPLVPTPKICRLVMAYPHIGFEGLNHITAEIEFGAQKSVEAPCPKEYHSVHEAFTIHEDNGKSAQEARPQFRRHLLCRHQD